MKLTYQMKYQKIIEFISNNPNFPWLFALSIPMIGYALGYRGFNTAFFRSGAIMVMLAVTSVYLNHFVIKTDMLLNAIRTKIDNPSIDNLYSKKMYLDRKEIDFQSEEDRKIIEKVKALGENDIKELQKIQKKIISIEFLSGIVGTFIWGFGDLFFP